MWSRERSRLAKAAAALVLAGALGACFQPLYGERTAAGGGAVREALAAVEVAQIDAPRSTPLERLAVETRNELLFNFTGGAGSAAPTHRLNVRLIPSSNAIIIDPLTSRAEFETLALDAYYTLVEIATKKTVVSAQAVARASFDIPGQEQRFAKARGKRDAESRAARMIADQIRSRLASYFLAGT